MTKFVKVEGESVWINVSRIDGVMVRPQLQRVGESEKDPLEERHELTGAYEVAVFFQDKIAPVRSFPSRDEAEAFIQSLLGDLEA